MALTRYRLPASGTAPASPALQSYTHNAPATVRSPLPTSDATALATVAYTPDAADHGGAGDSLHRQFVSSALTAGTAYSVGNTIKLAVQGLEPHQNNNLKIQVWVGVYSSSDVLQQTLLDKTEQAAELATSLENRFLSTTVANAYTTVTGDYLVVEISVAGSPGGGGGVQGHNASLRWGSDGAGGDLPENDTETGTTFNPWFEIQEDEPPITGDLAATDPQDTAAAAATVAWYAALAATEAQDSAAFTGTVSTGGITGDLAATDPVDTAAATATVAWYAALAATEAQDTASAGATVAWYAVLAATDPQDTASMAGDVTGGGAPPADEFIVDMIRSRRRLRILKVRRKYYKEKP